MGIRYRHLDAVTRTFMLAELDRDVAQKTLWYCNRLTGIGVSMWSQLLMSAVEKKDDDWLVGQLLRLGLMKSHEEKPKKVGTFMAKIPPEAATTLAEGEFNRLYIRGVCARALSEGIPYVVVERGKAVMNPRVESEDKLGARVNPKMLLEDLRRSNGVATALGIPAGPNSGITVGFPAGPINAG